MNTYKIITILAAIIAIAGLTFQLYADTTDMDNDIGTWMVILALGITIVNELMKRRNK